MEIKVINKSKHNLPEYATLGSAGMDLKADLDEPIMLKSLERAVIPTGLYLEIPEGYEVEIRPRSGLAAREGIMAALGTIDKKIVKVKSIWYICNR